MSQHPSPSTPPFASTTAVPAAPRSAQDLAAVQGAQWRAVLASPPPARAAWLLAAAQLGHAESQAVLGQLLLDGNGIAADAAQALHWFLCAAQQGDAMAMNMAGRCHEQGWGTAADAGKAAAWYRQAAAQATPQDLAAPQDRTAPQAQAQAAARYNLANLLAAGSGVPRDHAAAFALYRQAAQQGFAKAYAKLGRYHEDGCALDGLQLPADATEAARCYQRGAEGGDFRSQFNHAGMLASQGRWDEALQWLQRVPATAHARYLAQAGGLLARSPHPALQALGRRWMAGEGAGPATKAAGAAPAIDGG